MRTMFATGWRWGQKHLPNKIMLSQFPLIFRLFVLDFLLLLVFLCVGCICLALDTLFIMPYLAGAYVLLLIATPFIAGYYDPLNRAKRLTWGTYGLHESGDIHKLGPGPLRQVRLSKCDSDHLRNILRTQHQITDRYRAAINLILESREAKA